MRRQDTDTHEQNVYSNDDISEIGGNYHDKKFLSTDIELGKSYSVCYLESKQDGVKRITFNNNDEVRTYSIKMFTLNKSECGDKHRREYGLR